MTAKATIYQLLVIEGPQGFTVADVVQRTGFADTTVRRVLDELYTTRKIHRERSWVRYGDTQYRYWSARI